MLEIQRKKIESFAKLLTAWGVPYKIQVPDGPDLGDLEVAAPVAPRRRSPNKHPLGTVKAYFLPYLEQMQPGGYAEIPFAQFDPESLRGAVAAWCSVNWGKGQSSTSCNRKSGCVEVIREYADEA